MKVIAPLFNFWCKEGISEFKITKYFSIKKEKYNIKNDDAKDFLSKYERSDISECDFLAEIDNEPKDLSPGEILNAFLLSIWFIGPTKVTITHRFEEPNTISRMLDRFQPNKKDIFKEELSKEDLNTVANYFKLLIKIRRSKKRLFTALANTYQGCIAHQWKVAFVLFTAALEAMLTYSRDVGITKRLSKSYACVVGKTKYKRDRYYRQFYGLYSVRSDIMHGRIRKYSKPEGNLKSLSKLAILLRKLWQGILENAALLNALEKDDMNRKHFFKNLEQGYIAP
jgi:hypothetical protein